MNICIIGSGNVGGALAKSLSKAGHRVIIGTRRVDSDKIKALLTLRNVLAQPIAEAVANSQVVILATPPAAVIEIAGVMGDVRDKVIIDATNAVFNKPEPYANGIEAVSALTNATHVVKCFNTTGFENMADPVYNGQGIDMFVAGDSAEGKRIASQLARDIGFAECYDFGGADRVALLEQFALAWINLAIMQKQDRNIAFKVIKR